MIRLMKFFSGFIAAMLFCFSIPIVAQGQDHSPADITIERNGISLRGKFYMAEGGGDAATLLLLQGFPGNETDVLGLCERLARSGIHAMIFNFSGTHQSGGLVSFSNSQADIAAAYEFLYDPSNVDRFGIDTASVILGGYSYGGGMAMTYAIKHPEIDRVISIAGNDWGEHLEDYLRNPEMKAEIDASMDWLVSSGIVRFEPGEKPEEFTANGLDDLDPALYLKRNAAILAQKDILLLCGWNDTGVPIDRYTLPMYRALQEKHAMDVEIVAFRDDHSFGKSRDGIAEVITEWINQHAGTARTEESSGDNAGVTLERTEVRQ